MNYLKLEEKIIELCLEDITPQERIETLSDFYDPWNRDKLLSQLLNGGVIPESFDHDSSEEKLYAKFCDVLLEKFFKVFDMDAELFKGRGDKADVIAKNDVYSIVGDAKAFRLSRTALNPKDFKLAALNTWRKNDDATYACLVGPYHDFPGSRSRLFREAVEYEVTLISYTHLYYLLTDEKWKEINLEPLWTIHDELELDDEFNGDVYWSLLEEKLHEVVMHGDDFQEVLGLWKENLQEIGQSQISFLTHKIERIKELSKDELISKAIKDSKIGSKIYSIKRKL